MPNTESACLQCGTALPGTARACPSCGTPIPAPKDNASGPCAAPHYEGGLVRCVCPACMAIVTTGSGSIGKNVVCTECRTPIPIPDVAAFLVCPLCGFGNPATASKLTGRIRCERCGVSLSATAATLKPGARVRAKAAAPWQFGVAIGFGIFGALAVLFMLLLDGASAFLLLSIVVCVVALLAIWGSLRIVRRQLLAISTSLHEGKTTDGAEAKR